MKNTHDKIVIIDKRENIVYRKMSPERVVIFIIFKVDENLQNSLCNIQFSNFNKILLLLLFQM